MCVEAGLRPGRGGRWLLPREEADSGWEPRWGRLLLLQAKAGRRPGPEDTRCCKAQASTPPALQPPSLPPFCPMLWDSVGISVPLAQNQAGHWSGPWCLPGPWPSLGGLKEWSNPLAPQPPCLYVGLPGLLRGWSRPCPALCTHKPSPHNPRLFPWLEPTPRPSILQFQRILSALESGRAPGPHIEPCCMTEPTLSGRQGSFHFGNWVKSE